MLWIILTLMTALAAVGLAVPLVRRHDAARRPRNEVAETLKTQLTEIDAQAAAGVMSADDAESLKTDVKRRLLAEGREAEAPSRPLGERALLGLALGLVAVVVLAATGLYLAIGKPNVAGKSAAPAAQAAAAAPGEHPQGDVASMIAVLEQRMKETPDNAEGWRMLGWSYLQTGRNAEAAQAYGRAATLAPKNAEYLSAQGEATVLASGGQVTPAAGAAFRKALAADPADPRARYYLAVAKDQSGDHKGAMADWIAMLKTAPADAPWVPEVRTFVEQVAKERGVDLTGQLPPMAATPAPAAGPVRGPSAADVQAAGQMGDQDRQAMIEGMVGRLATRLKAQPNDRAGWEQLIRAYMVLGRTDQAAGAYREGAKALPPAEGAALKASAVGLGVPGT
ncbi:MAG: C-type cytochrome biosis protein CcmI [Caulobacteraceae bacterium]|nr:C-type cytochrome biosis protein CcmI [Caulobacteraceae bacterium]